jgi:hypothetical protein
VRLARAFIAQGHTVRLVGLKDSTVSFLRISLHGTPAEVVQLGGVTDWIELIKSHGRVRREATASRVDAYARYRQTYQSALEASGVLNGIDKALELGVPPLAAALEERIPSVTLMDHAWSLTLRHITGDRPVLDEIAGDERKTSGLFLLPEPVTPTVFSDYWRSIGLEPIFLDGMIGGGDQRARKEARLTLGLDRSSDVVFISGAGTSVWDGMLRRLVNTLLGGAIQYHAVVFWPSGAGPWPAAGSQPAQTRSPAGWQVETARRGNVTFVGRVRGETHHALIAAADLVVSRAGGGTVSDAIAHRVPLILVEEPGHWQVEEIRRSCAAAGLARLASLDRFRKQPRAVIESSPGRLRRITGERHRMKGYGQFGEELLVKSF